MQYKNKINYNLSEYNCRCPVCDKQSRNNKCFIDHIFHRHLKDDEEHSKFARFVRYMTEYKFLQKAKITCPVCSDRMLRSLGNHFRLLKDDKEHNIFLEKQTEIILLSFKNDYSTKDIEKQLVFMNNKWICKIIIRNMGKDKAIETSKKIFGKKRESFWNSFSLEERKKKMDLVRNAEWGHLTREQRKNHPWVIAGRKASLESTIRGSKNQKYAFELLKAKIPNYNWIYNYTLNEDWQIDIAAPEQKIFIEWDGKFHRVPVFGEKHLNNIKNKDKLKNGIVTKQLNGTMIRVNDGGRFNKKFVEEKVDKIISLIEKNVSSNVIIL